MKCLFVFRITSMKEDACAQLSCRAGLVPYSVHERVPSANAYRLVLIPHSTCVVQMVPQTGTALQHARTLDGKLPDELKYCEEHAAGSKVYYRCW